jgi:prepilin-type processing-associated H-X9-DG protein
LAVLFPVFERRNQDQDRRSCQSNLKLIAKGMLLYTQDWDKRLPLVKVNDTDITPKKPFGWADALGPYIKSQFSLRCRNSFLERFKSHQEKDPRDHTYSDYYFNARLNGIKQQEVKQAVSVIMLGDGKNGTRKAYSRYSLERLPAAWREDTSSPLYRHFEGANYAFVDGHVKWLKPDKITDLKAIELKSKPDHFTFAIK